MKRKEKRWTHATVLDLGMAVLLAFAGIGNAAD